MLAAASVARTSKVWLPPDSAGEIDSGLVQELQLPPSTRHSNVEPLSEELKLKLGVVLPDGSARARVDRRVRRVDVDLRGRADCVGEVADVVGDGEAVPVAMTGGDRGVRA